MKESYLCQRFKNSLWLLLLLLLQLCGLPAQSVALTEAALCLCTQHLLQEQCHGSAECRL